MYLEINLKLSIKIYRLRGINFRINLILYKGFLKIFAWIHFLPFKQPLQDFKSAFRVNFRKLTKSSLNSIHTKISSLNL